jgi:phosphoribosylformylglycinamidine (FGAM) synthase-like enzyme
VWACQGLYNLCIAYDVPLISREVSMKNGAHFDGFKNSIPPTLLVSAMGQTDDDSRALTLEPLETDERVYALGPTRAELAGSGRAQQTVADLQAKRPATLAEIQLDEIVTPVYPRCLEWLENEVPNGVWSASRALARFHRKLRNPSAPKRGERP